MAPVESLKFLAQQTADASPSKRIFRFEADPPHVYHVVQADGKIERMEAPLPPDDLKPSDLPTVAKIANVWADSEVWYSRKSVVVVEATRHRATLSLEPSPQLVLLKEWERANGFEKTQSDLIRILRTTLADACPDCPDLLKTIRGVRGTKAAEINQQITQGRVSLSKSMVAEMTGTDGRTVPEEVTFSIPVFAAASLANAKARVRVAIDPIPEKESFTLITLPGQIEQAYASGEAYLAKTIAALLVDLGCDSPVYFGAP